MSVEELTFEEIRAYLVFNKWGFRSAGEVGELWSKENNRGEEQFIQVPKRPAPELIQWRDVIERISVFESLPFSHTRFRIKHPNMDITRVRGASDIFIKETIPLKSGVGLVGSTYKMLRASATTARKAKPHIGGGFSKTGDEIISRARLGQTEVGSYIIPILMPLSEVSELNVPKDQMQISNDFRDRLEPFERRVTRTFAQALQALDTFVITPGVVPQADAIKNLVTAGVSRELVIAIGEILKEGGVSTFDATFEWASSIPKPSGVPTKVSISSESQELLKETARKLKTTKEDPNQSLTGPIVYVEHFPMNPIGIMGFQTIRKGRVSVVRVLLDEEQIHRAMKFMDTSRQVIVAGRIEQDPGKPARIIKPTRFNALDQDYLSSE